MKLVAKDEKTITVKTYPSKGGYPYELTQHTWRNFCPLCKKKGTLTFNPKGVPEGEITCSACDADYCGTSGKDKATKVRASLQPASVTGKNIAKTQTQSQKCNLTRAESKVKAKSLLNTGTTYQGKLEVPANLKISVDDPLVLNFKGFSNGKRFKNINGKTLYVDSMSFDVDANKLSLDLIRGTDVLGEPYDGDYIITKKNGSIVTNRNRNNPFQGKPTTINTHIGDMSSKGNEKLIDALKTPTIKKIMLKGQELGSISKIYKYLKVKEGGGTGGFKYKYYIGHKINSENETEFGAKSAEKCWKNKTYNCVDASWLFWLMCIGAKKYDVEIIKTQYTDLSGVKRYHMYNRYKGKTYDVSQNMKQEVDGSKVVVVK